MNAFMAFLLLETWFESCLFDQIASNGSTLKTFDQCEFKLSVLEGSGSWRDQILHSQGQGHCWGRPLHVPQLNLVGISTK